MYIENIITKLRPDVAKFEPHISDFYPTNYRKFLITVAENIAGVIKISVSKIVVQETDGTFINPYLNEAANSFNKLFRQNRTFGQDDYGNVAMLKLGTFYSCEKRRTCSMSKGVDDFGNTFSEKQFTGLTQ